MRTPTLFALSLALLSAVDLPGQERGRRGRRPGGPPTEAPAAAPAAEPAKNDKPKSYTAIVGGDVYLGTGQRLTGATVLIADDKIETVGHNLKLPEGTVVIDAKGKCVSPGFVAVAGGGMGADRNGPYADTVNPFAPDIKQGLAAGVTSFLAGSTNGRGTPGGSNAVVKLAYGDLDGMVLRENPVVGISMPMSTDERDKLYEQIDAAKKYLQEVADYPAAKAKDEKAKAPQAPRGGEKLVEVLEGKASLWVNLGGGSFGFFRRRGGSGGESDVDAIRQGLDLAKKLGRGVVLVKPTSAWVIPDEIAATGSKAILSPRTRVEADPKAPDHTGSNLASAAILARSGVPVAVTCPVGMFGGAGVGTNGILGQDLNTPNVDVAYAVRGGLDNRKALRTITLDAAEMLGVADRVGSIEPGKDADILILDGDPLHYATFVTTAIVNGKVVYEKGDDALYRHIDRHTDR
ncbi:MAG: amidohydrolase family protein [Planctomycetes bacterium]|nr:amidohydrolase family protein [Planctomycetota bacterium]